MRDLIPEPAGEFHVLELSCGEGLLSETILARFPASVVHGSDGSPTMLAPGGVLAIADLIQPATKAGTILAAYAWDEAVRGRSLALDGDETAYRAFQTSHWNLFRYPDDPIDKPSRLLAQLRWLEEAGFGDVDVYWMDAGHAIFAGFKPLA